MGSSANVSRVRVRRRPLVSLAGAIVVVALTLWPVRGGALFAALPDRLSDAEFWRLIDEFSEPNGYFQSENLVGNERALQHVVPALMAMPRGEVYLGVAPDQNFTYIVALEPAMAFIVDIRRGNLLQHLMYKAVIELSPTRADMLARLFSRARPEGLAPDASVAVLLEAFRSITPTEEQYQANLAEIVEQLTVRHGFALSESDLVGIGAIYRMFFAHGPALQYSMGGAAMRYMPLLADMLTATDLEGRPRSYLATEAQYQWLRVFQSRNLVVPIVGDFAGPRALRAIGAYVAAHRAVVSAFYTSNVEQYLFRNAAADRFYLNLATLPVADHSVIIRSALQRNVMDPVGDLVRQFQAGRVTMYSDVTSRGHVR